MVICMADRLRLVQANDPKTKGCTGKVPPSHKLDCGTIRSVLRIVPPLLVVLALELV